MNIIAKFINHRLQEELIEDIKEEKIPHRVKADRSIQLAKKWEDDVEDICVGIIFDIFGDKTSLYLFGKPDGYTEYINQLAHFNLSFITFVINDEYMIATLPSDSKFIAKHIKPKKLSFLEDPIESF